MNNPLSGNLEIAGHQVPKLGLAVGAGLLLLLVIIQKLRGKSSLGIGAPIAVSPLPRPASEHALTAGYGTGLGGFDYSAELSQLQAEGMANQVNFRQILARERQLEQQLKQLQLTPGPPGPTGPQGPPGTSGGQDPPADAGSWWGPPGKPGSILHFGSTPRNAAPRSWFWTWLSGAQAGHAIYGDVPVGAPAQSWAWGYSGQLPPGAPVINERWTGRGYSAA